jgi:N-acetylglucosaminyldiphosphoundecaprenol N-acetyl-beta-D-mannosaminyltransferase
VIDRGRLNVLGIRVAAVDYDAAVESIVTAARERRPLAVSALAVHGVMTGVHDPVHRYRLNRFDLLVPDGQAVRWAMRWLHGVCLPDRVRGVTLTRRLCLRAAADGLPIFLFGGHPAEVTELAAHLTATTPGLRIAGVRPAVFRQLSAAEQDDAARAIRDSGARLTFVGLGCPRQEVWVFEHRERLDMPLVAVGAAFGVVAGRVREAPLGLQRAGLEWLYRLGQEPLRLWKRYLLLNPLYLALVALQWTAVRRFDPDRAAPPKGDLRYG